MDAPVRSGAAWRSMPKSPALARLGVIFLLFAIWEIGVRLFGDPLFFSPPSRVVAALVVILGTKPILVAFATTFWELVAAFLLSVAIGLPVGLVLGLHPFSRRAFYPMILLLYALPLATILPLVVLAFGIGPASKIAFGVGHGAFPIIVSVVAGVQNIKPSLIAAARSMGASRRQILLSVVLPHAVPSFFTGIRLATAAVLLGVLLAELYVSQAGVGYFTSQFTDAFEPSKLFAIIGVLAAIAVMLNALCGWAERYFTRWHV